MTTIKQTRRRRPKTAAAAPIRYILSLTVAIILVITLQQFYYFFNILHNNNNNTNNLDIEQYHYHYHLPVVISEFYNVYDYLMNKFYSRYGGEDFAQQLLSTGLKSNEETVDDLLKRVSVNNKNDGQIILAAAGAGHRHRNVNRTVLQNLSDLLHKINNDSDNSNKQQQQQQFKISSSYTAFRLLKKLKKQNSNFIASFGGYSVTVGRGNFYQQSYPMVFGEMIQDVFESFASTFKSDNKFIVRNQAIGGIPSFPYGWCMNNFLGNESDFVSWEFGMNEGSAQDGLESYFRHAMLMSHNQNNNKNNKNTNNQEPTTTTPSAIPPMFLLADGNRNRNELLRKYQSEYFYFDAFAIHADAMFQRIKRDFESKNLKAFDGFAKWDEWGSNSSCPGQQGWHYKLQQHELVSWVLTVHFLEAFHLVAQLLQYGLDAQFMSLVQMLIQNPMALPPVVSVSDHDGVVDDISFLRFGGSTSNNNDSKSHHHHIQCRTSFQPNVRDPLTDIIVEGSVKYHEDLLQRRNENLIESSWVLDVGKLERDTKMKVEACGGLGYIDMKEAVYGVHASGVLKFELPHDNNNKDGDDDNEGRRSTTAVSVSSRLRSNQQQLAAKELYRNLIICEVNEKRPNECDLIQDVEFTVGGVVVSSAEVSRLNFTGVAYLGKQVCIQLPIPQDAKVVLTSSTKAFVSSKDIALPLEVRVTNENVPVTGACSISHIVWESL